MNFELLQTGQSTVFELPCGTFWIGGGEADHVRLPGLGAGLVKLEIEAERVTLTTREPLRIARALFPAGVSRLLAAGEAVELPGGALLQRSEPAAQKLQTAMVLKKLLCEVDEPQVICAAALTCLTGLDMGRRFPIEFARGVIGRGYKAAVRIRDRAVSRHHARIQATGEGCQLVDLGGMNGVFLNGKRLRGAATLCEGDLIEMGHTLLRFEAAQGQTPQQALDPKPAPAATSPRHSADWVFLTVGLGLAISGLCVGFALG